MAHKRASSRTRSSADSTRTRGAGTAANTSRAMTPNAAKRHPERTTWRDASAAELATAGRSAKGNGSGAQKPFSPSDVIRSNPWVFGGALLAIIAVIIYFVIQGTGAPTATPLAAATRAPNFALTASDGKQYSLSQYRGHVVVLEFFAPWCPHCRNETSVLNQIAKNGAAQGVQVLSVTATPYGYNYESSGGSDTTPISMKDVTEFVTNYHVTYPAMLDTSLKVGNAYGVTGFPQLYVIDRNGNITWNNGDAGEETYSTLQTQIQKAQSVPYATASATAPGATSSATAGK